MFCVYIYVKYMTDREQCQRQGIQSENIQDHVKYLPGSRQILIKRDGFFGKGRYRRS